MDIQLAFQNADVLRAIVAHGGSTSTADLARLTGKDKSNLHKTIGRLVEGGVLSKDADGLSLAIGAQAVIRAADIAEGLAAAPADGIVGLCHAQLIPDPLNPRKDLDSEAFHLHIDELRQDILQKGLLQNLVVRLDDQLDGQFNVIGPAGKPLPLYRIVAGECRWRAIGAAIADGDWPEDKPLNALIIETDDLGHRLRAFAENRKRRNMTPIEEARFFQSLIETEGWSTDQVADEADCSRRNVQLRLQLLQLSAADQARMSLPEDDEDHLTVREAKKKLQKPKAPPEPKPEDLTLVERMIVAELLVACANANSQSSYYSTEIAAEHSDGPFGEALAALQERGWVYVSGPGYQDGRWKVTVYFQARNWLDKAYADHAPPEVGTAGHLRVVARAIRTELHDAAAAANAYDPGDADGYATPWLNGPFELSAEGAAIVAQRAQGEADKAAKAEADAEAKTKARRAGRQAYTLARELEVDLSKRTGFANIDRRISATLEIAEAPLPWRVRTDGTVIDANGADVVTGRSGNERSTARMWVMVMAVNAAAGFNTPPEEPTENVLRRADFEKAMADYIALGFDDMDPETALGIARDALEAYLERHDLTYAAPNHSWTKAGAKEVVDDAPDGSAVNGGDEDEEVDGDF
ncbi:ParB/RepB/Spo0J family partition protein [Caulobacter sp. BE264]|uniref:MarR family transcriptional regulator n=1 Tax=Caulobacter sp. BE264 TaxID=2817724 RepID=UPI0028625E33|nr:MarR family transcriptional regulator [Caulobacter sp. BE264]MDR7230605.1 ParB/RepB/Spo0J family partition protein [Caulobacter sp. BE264]